MYAFRSSLATLPTWYDLRMECYKLVPGVLRIVYSTCSIHATENELVVRDALNSDEAKAGHFKLAPSNDVLPRWHRRGLQDKMDSSGNALSLFPISFSHCLTWIQGDATSLVRCLPGEDATNGFFVSCFVKIPEDLPLDNKCRKRKVIDSNSPRERKKKKKAMPASWFNDAGFMKENMNLYMSGLTYLMGSLPKLSSFYFIPSIL